MFSGPFAESIVARAIDRGKLTIELHNLRDWGRGKHRVVDDYPFGGGSGMVMKPEPFFDAVDFILGQDRMETPVILLTPQGRVFNQETARELSKHGRLLLICGHYEGVDARVSEHLATDEISIGDYVLTGGELAAIVVIDATVREIPGVLGSEESAQEESHSGGLLEYPHYTRPQAYRGWSVPEVLVSGHHAEVAKWRKRQSILRTLALRPDMLDRAELTPEERELVDNQAVSRSN